jgi:2-C-methyl-D-erythritol 4-phosphate cytidylyltransferase
MRNIHAVILAGGTGSRIGGNSPKQFLLLGGKALVVYSVELFRKWGLCKSITIVCHKDWMREMEETVGEYLEGTDRIIEGGDTRHDSTLNALASIAWDEEDIIFFHDAARPFFQLDELDLLVGSVQTFGAATLALQSTETTVISSNKSGYTGRSINRDEVFFVKTPQAVSGKMLHKLTKKDPLEESAPPTDLCSWMERIGEKTGIVPTSSKNIKITKPEDLSIAESFLR